MKKSSYLLVGLFALLSLASCKKSYPDFQITPDTSIVFDDFIDKATDSYPVGSTLNLKVAAPGTTRVSFISTYPVTRTVANVTTTTMVSVDLGSLPMTNGVATLTMPVNNLRAAANGVPVGAPANASAAVRAANTYTLTVDVTDGTNTYRRFYSALLLR